MTLIKPHITEKSMRYASNSAFTFIALPTATKSEIKQAVEACFGVHVVKLTTRLGHIPARRTGNRRIKGGITRQKLATVFLKPGEKIALFEFKETK